ncbi:phosphoglycerate mutase [Seiridium cupressi]
MSLEYIYVTRHGFRSSFTVDPASGVYTSNIHSPTKIPTDPPLTSYGVEQANELADHLLKLEPPIDQVYSSPYYRCLQTIDPFVVKRNKIAPAQGSSAKIRVEGGISEWFGHAPWHHPAPAPLSRLQELFPSIDGEYASQITPASNGETLSQLHDRVASALDIIIGQCDKEGKKAIVLCTHAAAVIALGRVLTGNMPEGVEEEDFAAFTCGLSIYRRRKGDYNQESVRETPADHDPAAEHRQSAEIVDPHSPAPAARDATPKWKGGLGVAGGWTCEANSNCSFLKGGPERGCTIGNHSLAGSGAGLGVDVEVQGTRTRKGIRQQSPDGSKL